MSDYIRTEEQKVLRDPIHGYIRIDYQVVWDVINSAWFQRLRRIRQLGGANMVYHCAEHTRFAHSLGVYELVRRLLYEVDDINEVVDEDEKIIVMLAGLLHDIGHGPYSHAFEAITNTRHEEYTCRIIEDNTEITKILNGARKGLAKDVADVIRHKYKNKLLSQMISSQLDADRMDYLLRDAYFTGTAYGEFDLERIFRTIRIRDNKLVIKQSGIYAIENYIMSRYHMYWQVYYHPVARSYEYLLHSLFKRLKDLGDNDKAIVPFLKPLLNKKKMDLDDYFELDDYSFNYCFANLVNHKDKIVKDLAMRLRDRHLFEYADNTAEITKLLKKKLKQAGYDDKYYWGKDVVRQRPYVPYQENEKGAIWILMKDGTTKEISNASTVVYSLIHGPNIDDNLVFFPLEIVE